MKVLNFLFFIFIVFFIIGCNANTADNTSTTDKATQDSTEKELNIASIDETTDDETKIVSADNQIDEVSGMFTDW